MCIGLPAARFVIQKFFEVIVDWTLDDKSSVVVGDFNYDFLCLSSSFDGLVCTRDTLLNFFLEADLRCCMNSSTRAGRCFDAVLSNETGLVSHVVVGKNFSTSDYAVVWFDIMSVPRKPVQASRYDYRNSG